MNLQETANVRQHHHAEDAKSDSLFDHPLNAESCFRAADLVASVRRIRGLQGMPVPEICILEFDGDLTDALIARGEANRFSEWPCFHTEMWFWESGDLCCGIVARTIGGPFAVLVAEQMFACGARVVIGITSAGRVSPAMPVPGVVVADAALRDEGTSLHYLAPSRTVEANQRLADVLHETLAAESLPLRRGMVWTTDAPYRETVEQLDAYGREGILAVEMQAASLFAYGQRLDLPVGLVAYVTNGGSDGQDFDKGDGNVDYRLLRAVCGAGSRFLQRHRLSIPKR